MVYTKTKNFIHILGRRLQLGVPNGDCEPTISDMETTNPVSAEVFEAIRDIDITKLLTIPNAALRPILPCLSRMSLCQPVDSHCSRWVNEKKRILQILSGIEVVNGLISLLSIDFHMVEQDARKEQQLRAKLGGNMTDSMLISNLQNGIAIEYERSDATRKLRLLLSEILFVLGQIREPRTDFYQKRSDLFESQVYLEEISDVLCIAQAELPSLLPMPDLAEALLHIKYGPWLMCRLVANVPDSFMEVCGSLVLNGEKHDEDSIGGRKRTAALQMLCQMNVSQILKVRSLCVEHCRLPRLAVLLTLQHCEHASQVHGDKELCSFVSGLLLGSDQAVRNWFAQFVRNGQKKKEGQATTLQLLRDKLLAALRKLIPHQGSTINEDNVVQGSAIIRLYCALKGIASLRISDDESKALLQLVTCHPPATSAGIRFVTLGLCMLIGCPSLLGNTDQERTAIDWIRWLLQEEEKFEKATGEHASFGEMLFLIAIHFHSNQTLAIVELVCNTLGMKSAVKANALSRLKIIFTQEIFSEQVVTSHAVKVATTPNLSATIPGFLPIHCIYQLLKSRAFSKHKVHIKDWIYKQICQTTTPLHPLLPPLIEVYINTVLLPSSKTSQTNDPFTDEEVQEAFKGSVLYISNTSAEPMETDDSVQYSFTCQLLLLYYLLLYEDCRLSNMKTIVASNRKVKSYSQRLMSQIPIKYLVQQAQKRQHQYASLFSPLIRLLSTHYPHLCLVEDWLDEEVKKDLCVLHGADLDTMECTLDSLNEAFMCVTDCPIKILLLLKKLLGMAISDMVPYAEVITNNLLKLLEPDVPRRVLDLVCKVWIRLNTVMPRRLWMMTVNSLRTPSKGVVPNLPYSQDDITVDPLIVLRCDIRVFRCPPLLDVTLRLLTAYLNASRAYHTSHIQSTPTLEPSAKQPNATANIVDRDELKKALLSAQESAAIQILLESCLSTPKDEELGGSLNLREVHCLICTRVHQMFISDPSLAKLVHFQGYPSELLSITVQGIPSMHICLDFIPELLSQPSKEKQMFAIELTSYLSLQYALPKSLSVAKLCVNVMGTLLGVLSCENRPRFFLPLLPSLERICRAFPPLCEHVVPFLTQLGKVCASEIAVTSNKILSGAFDDDFKPQEKAANAKHRNEKDIVRKVKEIKIEVEKVKDLPLYHKLYTAVQDTYSAIVDSSAL
ncbi:integrator complex subunit 2-like [Tubulanus polymorphus]|uniref:integrator complex subunit 2-like n=1 Tax=Tubulanus polymorphus TaxID=672921 RepID=UPI003DA56E6C